MGQFKEVDFESYCNECIHKPLDESESPCYWCISEPIREWSKIPKYFKKDEKKS